MKPHTPTTWENRKYRIRHKNENNIKIQLGIIKWKYMSILFDVYFKIRESPAPSTYWIVQLRMLSPISPEHLFIHGLEISQHKAVHGLATFPDVSPWHFSQQPLFSYETLDGSKKGNSFFWHVRLINGLINIIFG